MSKRVNKERICCLVGFYEEIIAVFLRKISQIDTQNEEKPKIFKFSLFLCCFCQIIDRTRGLQCKNPYSKERLLVSVGFR